MPSGGSASFRRFDSSCNRSLTALLNGLECTRPDDSNQPDSVQLQALRAPADGTIVDAIDGLLVCCEQLGWSGASRVLNQPIPADNPSLRLCEGDADNVLALLRGLVTLRNDGAEGHGLVGGYDAEAELAALGLLLQVLQAVTPRSSVGGVLEFGPERDVVQLRFLRLWVGQSPALIRRIKVTAADRSRVYAQVLESNGARTEFSYDTINPFSCLSGKKLPSATIWENSWSPVCYVPDRMTESFTGRHQQLRELTEWMNDSDSRTCLVYGDGGFGKTTLVVEFLHRLLEEDIVTEWKPKLILFYTAKRWQWGIDGLEPIGAGQPHLLELMVHTHKIVLWNSAWS